MFTITYKKHLSRCARRFVAHLTDRGRPAHATDSTIEPVKASVCNVLKIVHFIKELEPRTTLIVILLELSLFRRRVQSYFFACLKLYLLLNSVNKDRYRNYMYRA